MTSKIKASSSCSYFLGTYAIASLKLIPHYFYISNVLDSFYIGFKYELNNVWSFFLFVFSPSPYSCIDGMYLKWSLGKLGCLASAPIASVLEFAVVPPVLSILYIHNNYKTTKKENNKYICYLIQI